MYGLEESTVERILDKVGVAAVPGEKIQVRVGDKVRVRATLSYKGPALSDYFYGAIGNRGAFGFDEILNAQVAINFAQALDWTAYELVVDIPITTAISVGTYDLYVKIKGHTEAGLPEVPDCIDVIGAPEFQNFKITSYEKIAGA